MKRILALLVLVCGVLIAQDISQLPLDGESKNKLQGILNTLETQSDFSSATNALDDSIVTLQARANPTFYNNTNTKSSFIIWTSSGTTTSGTTTYIATNSSGTAIFANIYSIQGMGSLNTNVASGAPFCSVKQLIGTTSIVMNVTFGTNLLAAARTIDFVPNGTTNYITVFGD